MNMGREVVQHLGKSVVKCLKMNHFAVGCKNKKVRTVDYFKRLDSSSNEACFTVNSIAKNLNVEAKVKWTQLIKINNLNVEIKLNTGADVSIKPYSIYNKLILKPIIEKS